MLGTGRYVVSVHISKAFKPLRNALIYAINVVENIRLINYPHDIVSL